MSDISLRLLLLGEDRSGSKALRGVGNEATRTSRTLAGLQRAGRAAFLGVAAGAGLAAVAGMKFAKAAAEDEQSASRMAVAFRNNAKATAAQIAATEKWISAQGAAKGVADDELRPALSNLVRATHDVGEAQKLAGLAMDVSADTGKNLQTVSIALMKAENGRVDGLAKLGVQTKDAKGKTLALDTVLQRLAASTKGAAAKAADTAAGRYQRFKLALSETGEAIGYNLLPYMTDLGTWLTSTGIPALNDGAQKVADLFNAAKGNPALQTALGKIRDAAGEIATNVGDATTKIGGFAASLRDLKPGDVGQKLADGILSGLGDLAKMGDRILSLASQVDWVGVGIKMGTYAIPLALGLVTGILNGVTDPGLWKGIWDHLPEILLAALTIAFAPSKLAGPVAKIVGRIPFVGPFLVRIGGWLRELAGPLRRFGGELWGLFRTAVSDAFKSGSGGLFGRLAGTIRGLVGRLVGAIKGAAGRFGDAARSWVIDMGDAIGRGTGRVVAAMGRVPGRVVRALSGAGKLLFQKGVDIMSGLFRGISAGADKVLGKIGSIANSIKKKFSNLMGIFSPSRVFHGYGRFLMQGLANGITADAPLISKAMDRATARVKRSGEKLAGLLANKREFAGGFQWGTSIFGASDPNGDGTAPTISSLLAFAQQQKADAGQVNRDVNRVLGMGLSKALVRQLQSGGSSGMAALHALAQGTRSDIAQFNSLDKQTTALYGSAGMRAGSYLYDQQIGSARAQYDRDRQIRDLIAALDRSVKGDMRVEFVQRGDDLVAVLRANQRQRGVKAADRVQ